MRLYLITEDGDLVEGCKVERAVISRLLELAFSRDDVPSTFISHLNRAGVELDLAITEGRGILQ